MFDADGGITVLLAGAVAVQSIVVAILVIALRPRIGQRAGVAGSRAFHRVLESELERARRHERPLTIIRIEAHDRTDGERVLDRLLERLPLRRIDEVFAFGGGVYVVAPETGPDERRAMSERIALEIEEPIEFRGVCFPEEGLNADALLGSLQGLATRTVAHRPLRTVPRRWTGS